MVNIRSLILDSKYRFDWLCMHGFYNYVPDEVFLKKKYKVRMGNNLNLKNPKSYNEKIQWLKLYDRKPEYTQMVDKYEAKKYISERIGEQYVVPNYGVWNSFKDIDFSMLPSSFVLKTTHDSGTVVICHDKSRFNYQKAEQILEKSLKRNFYYAGREWPYKEVKPRIIAEKLLENDDGNEVKDYKFHCFNGKVKLLYITSDRFNGKGLKADYFDRDFNKLDIQWELPNSNYDIKKPVLFDSMLKVAEKLSEGIPTLRVDFYEVNANIIIGELTFYDGSGYGHLREEVDLMLGDYITLPRKYENI